MNTISIPTQQQLEEQYRKFILEREHPCIMAKSVIKMNHHSLHEYGGMHDPAALKKLLADLEAYLQSYDSNSNKFQSFLASFPAESFDSEIDFEKNLWQTLQQLHELDDQPWDPAVSSDPESADFSFSLKGTAFYVVGMHPKSSRLARQAPYPTLVFNLHGQFEKLRGMGTYETVRDTIRKNDEALQGSINPVLQDFGEESETRQYSGRHVEAAWKCPFHHK